MADWVKVRWTQARQIVTLIDSVAGDDVPEALTPEEYCSALRAASELEAATIFLAVALPRYETIVWAYDIITQRPAGRRAQATRDAIAAWIADPVDARRREARAIQESTAEDSPEKLLAHAVFLSGGSIAPPGLPDVNPMTDLCGRLAAAAVIAAAHASPDAATLLAYALDHGIAAARGATR